MQNVMISLTRELRLLVLLILLSSNHIYSQAAVEIPLIIIDGRTHSQSFPLSIGIDPNATAEFDTGLDWEMPPPPPIDDDLPPPPPDGDGGDNFIYFDAALYLFSPSSITRLFKDIRGPVTIPLPGLLNINFTSDRI